MVFECFFNYVLRCFEGCLLGFQLQLHNHISEYIYILSTPPPPPPPHRPSYLDVFTSIILIECALHGYIASTFKSWESFPFFSMKIIYFFNFIKELEGNCYLLYKL